MVLSLNYQRQIHRARLIIQLCHITGEYHSMFQIKVINHLNIINLLINHSRPLTIMKLQIKQQEVYDDLSESLHIIKNKLKTFLKKHQQNNIPTRDTELSDQEDKMTLRLRQLINKYRQVHILSPQFINITKRFTFRVKELLTQLINSISKRQLHLLVKIQRIELFTSRCVNKDNYGLAIASLLQIINNITNQSISSSFQHKQVVICQQRRSLTNNYDSDMKAEYSTNKTEFSQVKMILGQAQLYEKTMDIDLQHFRCKYFDLKQDNNQMTLNQILNRNKYIRSVMTSYQRDHTKHKSKQSHHRYQSQGKIIVQKNQTKTNPAQKARLTMTDRSQDSVFRNIRNVSNQQSFNNSFQINYQKYLNQQGQIQTFRNLYQQKINQKNHNIVKINNMVLPEPTQNLHIKNSNSKKLQFCKKSQEHQRYRYKYFVRRQIKTDNLVKGKTFNSQIISDAPDQI